MKKHDCINKETEKMKKESPNINYVRFDISTIKTIGGKKEQDEKTGQRIWIGYTHTKKDGSKVDKETKTFITHRFCPFCGKRYQ